jgi:hypothetical protein
MRSKKKNGFLKNVIQVSTLLSVITILASMILVVLQFADILALNEDELLCLILLLLIIIAVTLYGERFGMLREMREKLDNLTNQKK